MEKFFAREKELADLEELYRQPGFQMAVIYGRRRIGKSMLISEFIRDKKAIYHIATKAGADRNRLAGFCFPKFYNFRMLCYYLNRRRFTKFTKKICTFIRHGNPVMELWHNGRYMLQYIRKLRVFCFFNEMERIDVTNYALPWDG